MAEVYVDDKAFRAKLALLKDWTSQHMVDGMQVAQAVVIEHAKLNHPKAPKFGHPYPRYYDRTGRLTLSIRPGVVTSHADGITAEILAGGPVMGGVVNYAAAIEMGTVKHRAYPYLMPALEARKSQVLGVLKIALAKALG